MRTGPDPVQPASRVPSWPYLLAAAGLFLVWSNSFVAASYLLGSEGRAAQLDWVSLAVARFVPVAPEAGSVAGYGRVLAVTALAPLSWSFFSILSKPVMAEESPLVWTWLLRHLPATTVGFTVFLNPPLTTASKFVLALVGLVLAVGAPRRL